MNGSIKSRKNQNTRRKGKLQILYNIRLPQENKKTNRNQFIQHKSHQCDEDLCCPLVRYSGPFLKWMRKECQQMDQSTRKLMSMCPWCNGYRRSQWTWQHEFKSWTRLIACYIALIPCMNPIILPPAMGK